MISKEQSKDTGIIFGLIMIYTGIVLKSFFWLKLAFLTILISFLVPVLFYYPAILWFGFSEKLGSIVSKIVLAAVFIFVVLPVGLIRSLLKKDSMQIKSFKKGSKSSWIVREHKYSEKDILKPY